MLHLINIQWIGSRRDSGRGAVWGWFTETGKRETPIIGTNWDREPEPKCHMFYGRIGKKLHILECSLTHEFLTMIEGTKKNYRTVENPEKLAARWGGEFTSDLGMYLTMLKLKG